jgi:hypothetical protein
VCFYYNKAERVGGAIYIAFGRANQVTFADGSIVRFGWNQGSYNLPTPTKDDITTEGRATFECLAGLPRTSTAQVAPLTFDIDGRVCFPESPFTTTKCPCGVSGSASGPTHQSSLQI